MKNTVFTLAVAILFATSAFAKIIRVPADQSTIQAAINAAAKGDTVLVAEGTYFENINFKGKAITVASHFLMDADTSRISKTIINGSKPSHPDSGSVVFFISGEDTTSVLCGFTITKGSGTVISNTWDGIQYLEKVGGGILCLRAGARIVRNRIVENAVYSPDKEAYGGGVAADAIQSIATIILQDNHISRNTVTADVVRANCGGVSLSRCHGIVLNNLIDYNTVVHKATTWQAHSGGLACYSEPSDRREFIIASNTISHNSVTTQSDRVTATALAGGVLLQSVGGRFSQNEVSHNEIWVKTTGNAVGAGMEILEVADSFVIEGNIIRNNAITHGTGWGGGLGFGYCSPRLTNNVIAGNSATRGGAIFVTLNVKPRFINNTIVGNHASESGGALYIRNDAAPVLMNSIIWNNWAPTGPVIHMEAGTVRVAYCDIQGGWSGVGNINQDPRLVADSLSNNSPCIGAGVNAHDFGNGIVCTCPDNDVNGRPRAYPAGSNADLGAWESMFGTPTSVASQPSAEIPRAYALYQNHPNPFNPATTIAFALPQASFVTLKIYDLLGNEVATLVSEKLPAGKHRRVWEAKDLASGVYVYRIEAGEFEETKKLVLLR